ncbi:hypothetical protein KC340_g5507 [Hortaea werneckii]|nr:hypothetical protein KC342_g11714 [Hortaea werneckii]KAI7082049.1 hypothetical protein KC339_g13230 [Hortaea werneckii]KAI7242543.1 hypothetical protein KC365_g3055 [Hortaea werneckii]KAI7327639.1 hypothetical protein KC340_g5507 [Hortaea werneckii]KAI7404123.1 hypothetical protein KC328_g2038 [Hortaea werneckii]
MSIPGNINTAPPPSSFDDDSEFYEESRWAKLQRRIKEEPLIPLGCALTCWALIEATRSIRTGDKHRTNRMFRRRIYAQGFTVLAMVLGSAYWESDRKKRGEYNDLLEDKKKKEKHEAWLKELEAREEEEVHLRKIRDNIIQQKVEEKRTASRVSEGEARDVEDKARDSVGQDKGGWGSIRSAAEESERRGPIVEAVSKLWQSRRSSQTNLASNKWAIAYERAPVLSLLLVSRQWTAEYLKQAEDRMWVVTHLWLQEKDSESAPWFDDLPAWVRENVRGAQIVFYGVHRSSRLLESDPNISNIVKRKLNEAVSALPSLSSWEEVLMADIRSASLINDMESEFLAPRTHFESYFYLREPVKETFPHRKCGLLVWIPLYLSKDHPRDYLDIPRRSEKVERWTTWYVTRPAEVDAPYSFLDLDWEFVREVSDYEVDDDDEEYEDEDDEEDDEEEYEEDDGEDMEDDDDDDDHERFYGHDIGDDTAAR